MTFYPSTRLKSYESQVIWSCLENETSISPHLFAQNRPTECNTIYGQIQTNAIKKKKIIGRIHFDDLESEQTTRPSVYENCAPYVNIMQIKK